MRRKKKARSGRGLREARLPAALLILQAAALLMGVARPVQAQAERTERLRTEAEKYLRSCDDGAADTRGRCEANRQAFTQAYARARAGDYQAQRTVARLLAAAAGTDSATTPSSAVVPNRVEACAWRVVMIHGEQFDARDEAREGRDCERLPESERLAAELRAAELMALIMDAPAAYRQLPPSVGEDGS